MGEKQGETEKVYNQKKSPPDHFHSNFSGHSYYCSTSTSLSLTSVRLTDAANFASSIFSQPRASTIAEISSSSLINRQWQPLPFLPFCRSRQFQPFRYTPPLARQTSFPRASEDTKQDRCSLGCDDPILGESPTFPLVWA